MQCLERHDTPVNPGFGVWLGVCFVLIGLSVVVSGGVTPGPFPNPEAKPTCADGTAPGRVWESKSPPALKLDNEARSLSLVGKRSEPFCVRSHSLPG